MNPPAATHTPGPWLINSEARDIQIHTPSRTALIAVCSRIYKEDVPAAEANARLIAASPTMHAYILTRAKAGDGEAQKIIDSLR